MIIFDSSTLILLAKTEILELFISNFPSRILIPEKVMSEVAAGGEETPLMIRFIEDKRIEVLKVRNDRSQRKLMQDFNIDIGEAEALILALQEGASLIATDDRNAIRACKMLRLNFVTAIAILIRAFERGLIDKDEALLKLQKLQSFGRYGRAIIDDTTKQIKGGV